MNSFYFFEPPFISPAGVREKPFQAFYEHVRMRKPISGQVWERSVTAGVIYRDTEGRSRREVSPQSATGEIINTIIIYDPLAQEVIFLDSESKTILRERCPENLKDIAEWQSMSFLEYIAKTAEKIEEKVIEDLMCRGFRIRQPESGTIEYWISEELDDVVLASSVTQSEEETLRLYNIRRREPESKLFISPAHYKDNEEDPVGMPMSESAFTDLDVEAEQTLLDVAANGDVEGVQAFLATGVDVNERDIHGWTPLMNAAESGHSNIVEILLAIGADINAKTNGNETALMFAAWEGHISTVNILLNENADVNIKDNNGETALTIAAFKGYTAVVKALLAKGADANAQDNNGTTALMRAVESADVEIIQALLSAGANVSPKSKFGHTALGDARKEGYSEIIRLLEKAGAVM